MDGKISREWHINWLGSQEKTFMEEYTYWHLEKKNHERNERNEM
jgi:hypothetical protein